MGFEYIESEVLTEMPSEPGLYIFFGSDKRNRVKHNLDRIHADMVRLFRTDAKPDELMAIGSRFDYRTAVGIWLKVDRDFLEEKGRTMVDEEFARQATAAFASSEISSSFTYFLSSYRPNFRVFNEASRGRIVALAEKMGLV